MTRDEIVEALITSHLRMRDLREQVAKAHIMGSSPAVLQAQHLSESHTVFDLLEALCATKTI